MLLRDSILAMTALILSLLCFPYSLGWLLMAIQIMALLCGHKI